MGMREKLECCATLIHCSKKREHVKFDQDEKLIIIRNMSL